jgi:diguanylate cyclase (GGDEF)-like protein
MPPAARTHMEALGEKSRLIVPVVFGKSPLGMMVVSETTKERSFSAADIDFALGLAHQAGVAIHNARQYQELRRNHVAGLRALVSALGAKERYTQGHAARVATYVALMGEKLGWSAEMLQRAEEASVMHDIGKLAISDNILLKPGPLSEQEWAVVRAHPETSEQILRPLVDEHILAAIRCHHENYDGSGYPDGLKGDEIPPIARAIRVADAYDAMSFRRPYRRSLTYRECRRELERGRGSQFDPEMFDALLAVAEDIRRRRKYCIHVARKAAGLIDGDKHKLLRERRDEERAEYQEIIEALRGVLANSERVRFLTTLSRSNSTYVFIADPEEAEDWKSHLGDQLLVADEEMDHVYAGERTLDRNVVNADEFGVWISGMAPLYDSGGEIVGLVCADAPAKVSPDQQDLYAAPGFLASLLGEAGKRITRAEFEAVTDGLTGVYNHRFLHEHLDELISKSTHRQSEFAVLFIDIDHFKRFNDLWGHSLGDLILRDVAHLIENEVRRGDVVARYGGEEFVAVLADTSLAGGRVVAGRIRQKIARSPLALGSFPVTVSIGVTVFPTDGTSGAALIERADSAMYQAKRLGRNRVQVYSAAMGPHPRKANPATMAARRARIRRPRPRPQVLGVQDLSPS